MDLQNIQIFQDTLNILDRGSYQYGGRRIPLKLSRDQMKEVEVWLPQDIERIGQMKGFGRAPVSGGCQYSCEDADSFSLARKISEQFSAELNVKGAKPVLVLNLANAEHPGGGVKTGARAQEEDLCRKSSLFLSLDCRKAKTYYDYNRSLHTCMGSDAIMIHPQVEIIKDEKGNLLPETAIVAVMTCAAPILRYGLKGLTQEQYEMLVYNRISGMLKVAAYLGYRYLVLGAFGCGAFRNDARVVSDLFRKALDEFDFDGMKEADAFRRIDFAVMCRSEYDQYNYREFYRNFSGVRRDGEAVRGQDENRPVPGLPAVFFWKDNEENGCFSNWFRAKFVIDDFEYLHVEQYMMAQKAKLFHDSERYTAILRATKPWECKDLGKQVTPFDPAAWDAVKYDVVKTANRAKYKQNPELMARLVSTGNAVLAEASPKDFIWGIGLEAYRAAETDPAEWPGQNLLGRILMELRAEFSEEKGAGSDPT